MGYTIRIRDVAFERINILGMMKDKLKADNIREVFDYCIVKGAESLSGFLSDSDINIKVERLKRGYIREEMKKYKRDGYDFTNEICSMKNMIIKGVSPDRVWDTKVKACKLYLSLGKKSHDRKQWESLNKMKKSDFLSMVQRLRNVSYGIIMSQNTLPKLISLSKSTEIDIDEHDDKPVKKRKRTGN